MNKLLFLIALTIFGIIILRYNYAYKLKTYDEILSFLSLCLKAAFFIIPLIVIFKHNNFNNFSLTIIAWVLIFFIIIALYSYKDDIKSSKFYSNLIPSSASILSDRKMMYTAQDDGHFHLETIMNGKLLDCMLDTGASGIFINLNAAKNIGIDIEKLDFNIPINSANGIVYAARSIVRELSVGNYILLINKKIYVNSGNMNSCLLGMSFLDELESFSMNKNTLIINPKTITN